MNEKLLLHQLHGKIVSDVFDQSLSDREAFLLFGLLHNFSFSLRQPLIKDFPGTMEIASISQRGAALALACIWAGSEDERGQYTFWHRRWQQEWNGTEKFNLLEEADKHELLRIKELLENHPFVEAISPEYDFGLGVT